MDPQLWAEVEAIFAEAADTDTASRAALLAARCAGRPALRAEVDALLAAHDRASRFMEPTIGLARPDLPFGPGASVGPYRVTALLGEGGMAAVFRAEREDGTFEQRVAIKVVRTLLTDDEAARRFRAERQILAALHHPHIVTLLDGGTLPDGRPYLVMEFVDGVPVTQYCRDRALSLEARLRLFRDVCGAVQYAHRHAIVHRDLKPANILVTGDGVPKVLDFGVAKLLEGPTGLDHTATGAAVGPLTPNYASPEQLRGLPITTASDVYALGVLLYELITGTRPYDTAGQPLDRLVELVLRTDPPRPSVAAKAATTTGPAKARESRPPPTDATSSAANATAAPTLPIDGRRIAGDLDAIVLKALSKEPERRYASAGEFSDDVARFLGGKPVLAQEPSTLYVIRKLARRHRAVVAVAVAALIGVLAALGVALWQRQVALRQQARAERRFDDVRRIANALIFDVNEELARIPGSTAVRRRLIDEALRYLEDLRPDAIGDPELQLEVGRGYRKIAEVLGAISGAGTGERGGAIARLQQAHALVKPLADAPDAPADAISELVNVNGTLNIALRAQGRGDEARTLVREAVDAAERAHARAPQDPLVRQTLADAYFYQAAATERSEEALVHWRRSGELFAGLLAEKPDDMKRLRAVALVDKYVGSIFLNLPNRRADTERHFRRALELDERRLARAPDNSLVLFDVAIDLANLGKMHELASEHADAVRLYERSLAIRQRLAAADPHDVHARMRVGIAQYNLAYNLSRIGRLDDGHRHATGSVAALDAVAAKTGGQPETRNLSYALVTLGRIERARRRAPQACAALTRSVNIHTKLRADKGIGDTEYWVSVRKEREATCGATPAPERGSGAAAPTGPTAR